MKIAQCVKEKIHSAVAANPTLTPTDIASGKGVGFVPSAVDVASSHLGKVAREVKKAKESRGLVLVSMWFWSCCRWSGQRRWSTKWRLQKQWWHVQEVWQVLPKFCWNWEWNSFHIYHVTADVNDCCRSRLYAVWYHVWWDQGVLLYFQCSCIQWHYHGVDGHWANQDGQTE